MSLPIETIRSSDEYERLARLDHIALAPEELSDLVLNAIANAQPVPEAHDANQLLD